VDTGARHIATPSASIIGLCNTFTVGPPATAAANELLLITRESEAVAAWGPDAAITQDCKAIFKRSKAVIVAVGVPLLEDPAEQLSAIIGGVWADGSRTGMQALLNGKSKFNAQPRLLVTPGHSITSDPRPRFVGTGGTGWELTTLRSSRESAWIMDSSGGKEGSGRLRARRTGRTAVDARIGSIRDAARDRKGAQATRSAVKISRDATGDRKVFPPRRFPSVGQVRAGASRPKR